MRALKARAKWYAFHDHPCRQTVVGIADEGRRHGHEEEAARVSAFPQAVSCNSHLHARQGGGKKVADEDGGVPGIFVIAASTSLKSSPCPVNQLP